MSPGYENVPLFLNATVKRILAHPQVPHIVKTIYGIKSNDIRHIIKSNTTLKKFVNQSIPRIGALTYPYLTIVSTIY